MCASPNLENVQCLYSNVNRGRSNVAVETGEDSSRSKLSECPIIIVDKLGEVSSVMHNEPFSQKSKDSNFLSPFDSLQFSTEEYMGKELTLRHSGVFPFNSENDFEHKVGMESKVLNKALLVNLSDSSKSAITKIRPYSCTECGKSFLLKHHLTTHAKVHSGIRPHICIHCGKSFTHKHCLNTHLLLHSSDRPYQCPECKKSFTLKHHLLTHSRVHSRDRPFVCSECGRTFPLKRHLVTHSKFHAGERPFICEDCGESFAQRDHLVMHSRFHGSLNPFVCGDCGATFQRKFELVNHARLHGRLPQSCPICDKEFLQKRTLIAHMRYHTGDSPFFCNYCGEAFHTKNDLAVHTKMHINCEKPLSCGECSSSFVSPEALALHIKLHKGDSSLVDDLCTLTASLNSTQFPISINSLNRTVICANSASAGTKSMATVRTVSKIPQFSISIVTPKSKPHMCQYCSRAFSAKHGLQQHNKRHPEGTCSLKSHVCPTCDKGFYQKNHLLLHQRQHMNPEIRNRCSSDHLRTNDVVKTDIGDMYNLRNSGNNDNNHRSDISYCKKKLQLGNRNFALVKLNNLNVIKCDVNSESSSSSSNENSMSFIKGEINNTVT